MKTCSNCKVSKGETEFHRCSANRDGKQNKCMVCSLEYARNRKISDPESYRRAYRKWKRQNKDKVSARLKIWTKQDRIKNPEKYTKAHRIYYEKSCKNNPAYKERRRKARWLRIYGLTEIEYAALLGIQSGNCKVCNFFMVEPHIDHCHKTGKVRGLLCQGCNIGLGAFKESTASLLKAIEYLKSNEN